jgi:SpoVK/Ycf46/Vps4 family AAA+-type ATPase
LSIDGSTLDALADRFRMSTVQIADAVSSACNRAELHTHSTTRVSTWATSGVAAEAARARGSPSPDDLFAGARAQSGDSLAALAHRIEPRYGWKDLVLPLDSITQLHEICQRVAHRHRVLGEWGFDRKLSLGKGVNALFAGPPGTGKTMAAEIIANELELDLYRIDLAGVVSKYIGETEKNLDRVFSAAEDANAILFFDEADALFGKRSEVRDSHDRYANLEISYLLQKMEEHEGVAILATNLRQNLDDAFMRRVAFTVHFPFPDESSRRRIWEQIWPPETPLADDVNFDAMARRFRLSGGNIKNIALASAFLAAEDGARVTMAHLQQATRREHQKMGKTLIEPEAQALDREAQVVTTRAFLSGTVTGAS